MRARPHAEGFRCGNHIRGFRMAGVAATAELGHGARKKPLYTVLYVQVLFAIVLGGLIGWLFPDVATNDWIKAAHSRVAGRRGGRQRVLRPCPYCRKKFNARDLREHIPQCDKAPKRAASKSPPVIRGVRNIGISLADFNGSYTAHTALFLLEVVGVICCELGHRRPLLPAGAHILPLVLAYGAKCGRVGGRRVLCSAHAAYEGLIHILNLTPSCD